MEDVSDAEFLKAIGVMPMGPEPMVPAVRWAIERDAKDVAVRAARAWCEEARAHHAEMVWWRALALALGFALGAVVLAVRL